MDVVYVVKENQDNLELKYSLRSLKNIKHDKVYIVGHKPYWVRNVIHIPAEDPYSVKSLNALHKIKIACEDERISDDFILMNDDFYILNPIKELKYFNRGKIKDHFEFRKEKKQENSIYGTNLKKTLDLFPNGYDFSLHIPIIYNKNKFLEMCKNYDMTKGYLLRNLYGNHYGIVGEYREDCKFYGGEFSIVEGQEFLSSDDNMIGNKEFLQFMEDNFGERCEYERVPKEYNSNKFDFQKFQHIMKYEGSDEAMLYRDFCINSCKKL